MEILIASCKESAVSGMEQFLKTLSFVPDDRLDWTPSPSAKGAIRIAAHTAIYAGVFAKMIRERKLPFGDEIPEFVARISAAEKELIRPSPPIPLSPPFIGARGSVTEIESLFRRNTDEVLAALDTLTPEAIGATLDTGLGWTLPMTRLMMLPGSHAFSHAAQIDYIQTCWGDQEVHF